MGHNAESTPQSVEATLAERAATHGDYSDHAEVTQAVKGSMRCAGWERLTDCEREALEMIAHKVGRILAGNPHYRDHWHDIAGYATLVADRCPDALHAPR